MFDSDKKQFAQIVRATMLVCGGEAPEPDVLRIWWAALQRFDVQDVSAAFSEYAIRGKYAPKPADILEIMDRIKPDGRPGADEAWAMMPHDEYASAVISDEMAEAFGVAKILLDEGDKIAARMAFKEAYNRIVAANKRNGIPPSWFPSLGMDAMGREPALKEAVRLGRISQSKADALLPYREESPIVAALIGNTHLRLAAVDGEQVESGKLEFNRQKVQELKAMLKAKANA